MTQRQTPRFQAQDVSPVPQSAPRGVVTMNGAAKGENESASRHVTGPGSAIGPEFCPLTG